MDYLNPAEKTTVPCPETLLAVLTYRIALSTGLLHAVRGVKGLAVFVLKSTPLPQERHRGPGGVSHQSVLGLSHWVWCHQLRLPGDTRSICASGHQVTKEGALVPGMERSKQSFLINCSFYPWLFK